MSLLSGRGVPVLMYHWVNPDLGDRLRLYGVTPGAFGRQIRRLRAAGYRSAGFPELLRHVAGGTPLPPKSIVLTLDDGYCDNLEYAAPILEEAGFTATIFLVTDRAGGVNEWDLKHGDPPRPLLDWAAARARRSRARRRRWRTSSAAASLFFPIHTDRSISASRRSCERRATRRRSPTFRGSTGAAPIPSGSGAR